QVVAHDLLGTFDLPGADVTLQAFEDMISGCHPGDMLGHPCQEITAMLVAGTLHCVEIVIMAIFPDTAGPGAEMNRPESRAIFDAQHHVIQMGSHMAHVFLIGGPRPCSQGTGTDWPS